MAEGTDMANELHTMPLKIERLLSSANVQALSIDEFGVYIKLLCHSWLNAGALPTQCQRNANALRMICGIDEECAERCQKTVIDAFWEKCEDGKYRNKTQAKIYADTIKSVERKSGVGKEAAKRRWESQCQRNANAMPTQCQPNANQNQNQSQIVIEETPTPLSGEAAAGAAGRKERSKPVEVEIPEALKAVQGFAEAWADWIAYRRERRVTTTPRTLRAQLAKLSEAPGDAVESVRQSIANGWQGIFPLRGAIGGGGHRSLDIGGIKPALPGKAYTL